MNSILAKNPIEEKARFWVRHSRGTPTSRQVVFDILFGILLPLFCFYLDPGIVRGRFSAVLGELSMFIYSFSGLAMLTLSIWLAFEHRTGSLSAIFGGVFLAGSIISFSIGVLILPLTVIGILFVIGLLGLVPFVTGFVYLRNGLRAIDHAGARAPLSPRFAVVALSAAIAIALPGGAQWAVIEIVNRSTAEILDQNLQSIDAPVARIKLLRFAVDTDRFVRLYENEQNFELRERLERAYKEITGEEIERRLGVLND